MFVTEAYVKRVTSIGGSSGHHSSVLESNACDRSIQDASMRDSRQQFGGISCRRQASTARVTAPIANHISWLRFCVCSSRNCSVCESPDPTSNVRKTSEGRNGNVCGTSDSKWGSSPGGGYSQKNRVGVCGPLPKFLTLFMTKICDFPNPIYDLSKNLIPYL